MEWQVGDLVDWDGIFPNGNRAIPPRRGGRIVKVFISEYKVDWPGRPGICHTKRGSASRFTRHVMDTFDVDGIE